MKAISLLIFVLLGSITTRAQLEWRVSVKIILDKNGNRPNTGTLSNEDYINEKVDWANDFYRQWGRGYQFRVTEIVELSGHSGLFNADPADSSNNQKIADGAKTDPASWKWKNNAINVYLDNLPGMNSASDFANVILMGSSIEINAFAHECGHYLGLCHTHGCGCGNDCTGACSGSVSDNIADTIPDSACWSRDQVSNNKYGKNYAALTSAQQLTLDYTFNNLMSYHRPRTYLTPDQLDEIADTSNASAANVSTGSTWFVDKSNNCTSRSGSSACASDNTGGPYQTVTTGINKAGNGDIVLIRPGSYNEPMTIKKAVTLRATRGDATIGK